MRRRIGAVLALVSLMALSATAAQAVWTADAAGVADARSTSIPTGPTPTVALSGNTVTVSWARVSYVGTTVTVPNYTVARFKNGASDTAAASCSSTVSAVTCTDALSDSGSYTYAVTASSGLWVGAAGAVSASVTYTKPAPATAAGLAWVGLSTNSANQTPTCSGAIGGTYTCKFTKSANGQYASGYIAFVDVNGNEVSYSTSPSTITITGAASQPNITPAGDATIGGGASRSAVAKTVTMQGSSARSVTASFNGWTAVLTIGP